VRWLTSPVAARLKKPTDFLAKEKTLKVKIALANDELPDYVMQSKEGEISENALFAYLYLLKRTPSSKVRNLLVSLDEPAFERFMALCLDAMQDSFREARQRINENVRLAGN